MNTNRSLLRKHLVRGIFMGTLALLLLRAGGADVALAQSCGQWSVVKSPSTGTQPELLAVTAISPKNVWAVGDSFSNNTFQTLIEHWNGNKWSIVKSPAVTGGFSGIAAVSAKDIWAVGTAYRNGSSDLIEHWNGSSWSIVSSPNGGGLFAVAAVSANDVWAVGNSIIHWDGTSWSVAPGAPPDGLYGITVISANDIWAVGGYLNTLTMHWDGKQWSVIPSPTPPSTSCLALQGVTAISTHDVWAVGWYAVSCNVPPSIGFVEHWDGTQWSIVSIPSPGKHTYRFSAVAASSTNNVWAVGSYYLNTLTYHWDGTSWSEVPDPNVYYSAFYGVAVTPTGDFWAVGSSKMGRGGPFATLTEFYC